MVISTILYWLFTATNVEIVWPNWKQKKIKIWRYTYYIGWRDNQGNRGHILHQLWATINVECGVFESHGLFEFLWRGYYIDYLDNWCNMIHCLFRYSMSYLLRKNYLSFSRTAWVYLIICVLSFVLIFYCFVLHFRCVWFVYLTCFYVDFVRQLRMS